FQEGEEAKVHTMLVIVGRDMDAGGSCCRLVQGRYAPTPMSWNELLFDFVTLWVTVDPIGTVPLYLAVTKEMPAKARRRAAVRATIIAFLLLAAFLYFGQLLLRMMRIELLSFQIAGGIVLFLFSL